MAVKMAQAVSVAALGMATRTTTTNGAAVDVKDYADDLALTLLSNATNGGDVTVDCKVQDSPDGSTGWADVTGAVFTQVTNGGAAHETITIDTDAINRYIRIVATIAGTTPSVAFGVTAIGLQQVR